jgi:hypothetical protein
VHRLVEVDDRPGDHRRRVAEQVGDHRRDVLGHEQAPERATRVGRLAPVVGSAGGRLQRVLALGRGPADVQPVDADAVGLQLVAGVARERRERRLRCRVRGESGLAAVAGHRDDVDDAPAGARASHDARGLLHEQERRAGVDREEAVPELGGRVVERPAGAKARGVHEAVDAVEALVARAYHAAAVVRVGQVRGDEQRVAAELVAHRLSPLAIAAAHHHPCRSQRSGTARNRGAQPLGAPRDDEHLAGQALLCERVAAHPPSTSTTVTGRFSRSERQAASPMTSGARPSSTVTGGVRPARTASTKASHSPT